MLATQVMGASASVGVALGGVAGTVAGAAMAGVQGIVQGVSRVRTGQQALPDVTDVAPLPDPVPEQPEPTTRAMTTDDIGSVSLPRCARCDGDKRSKHTYAGVCEGFPPQFYFGPRRPSALANNASSSSAGLSDQVVPVPVVYTPGEGTEPAAAVAVAKAL